MAITSKLMRWLLDGGKDMPECILLADAMETMADARLIFEMHEHHLACGLDAASSCDELCQLAEEIVASREFYTQYRRNPMNPVFYVYHHIGNTSREVFYVGKGKGDRFKEKKGRSARWTARVTHEGGFTPVIVKSGMIERAALDFEQDEICRLLGECRLENIAGVAGR